MYDSMLHHLALVKDRTDALQNHGLKSGQYLLATIHRAENTDNPDRLRSIFEGFGAMARKTPVALSLHPRTRAALKGWGIDVPQGVLAMEPVSYLEMLQLERNALAILTDSGGVQKEAFFLGRPCLTLRDETEWVETVELGANTLAGADAGIMLDWHERLLQGLRPSGAGEAPYGDGRAAEKILAALLETFS